MSIEKNKNTIYVVVKNTHKNKDISNITCIGYFKYTINYIKKIFKTNDIDKSIIEGLQNNDSITVFNTTIEYDIISIYGIEADIWRNYNYRKQFINKEYNTKAEITILNVILNTMYSNETVLDYRNSLMSKSLLNMDISYLKYRIQEIAGIRNTLLNNNKNNMEEDKINDLIEENKRVYYKSDSNDATMIITALKSIGAKNGNQFHSICNIGTVYFIDGSNNIAAIEKGDRLYSFITTYYKKLEFEYVPKDKELVLAWKYYGISIRTIGFYNSKDKCLFSSSGKRLNLNSLKFDHYAPATPENLKQFKYDCLNKLK